MGLVAKSLGQYLGPRGKLPRPVVGNVTEMIERTKRSVKMASKENTSQLRRHWLALRK